MLALCSWSITTGTNQFVILHLWDSSDDTFDSVLFPRTESRTDVSLFFKLDLVGQHCIRDTAGDSLSLLAMTFSITLSRVSIISRTFVSTRFLPPPRSFICRYMLSTVSQCLNYNGLTVGPEQGGTQRTFSTLSPDLQLWTRPSAQIGTTNGVLRMTLQTACSQADKLSAFVDVFSVPSAYLYTSLLEQRNFDRNSTPC